jgi:hypothetical protein
MISYGEHTFLLSWDQQGLESCIDITEHEQARTLAVLSDQSDPGNVNGVVNAIILRAKFNSQRHYEVYAVEAAEGITRDDMVEMFQQDPQGSADLIRARGRCLHSDRNAKNKILIT